MTGLQAAGLLFRSDRQPMSRPATMDGNWRPYSASAVAPLGAAHFSRGVISLHLTQQRLGGTDQGGEKGHRRWWRGCDVDTGGGENLLAHQRSFRAGIGRVIHLKAELRHAAMLLSLGRVLAEVESCF
jgi:hypothetical protein